jgi:hypothetical protein
LIGADLSKINTSYLAILKSKELIAISQDKLGKQARLIYSESNLQGDELQLPRVPAGVTDEEYNGYIAQLRDSFAGVTDCDYDGIKVNGTTSAVGAEQKWQLDNVTGTIRSRQITTTRSTSGISPSPMAVSSKDESEAGGGSSDVCLTVGTPSGSSNETTVTIAPCVAGSAAQKWRGFRGVHVTTAPLMINMSAPMGAANQSLCLATDGSSLFVEPCVQDPAHCSQRGTDCPQSVRMPQLWYAMRNGQLLSTFTADFQTQGRCSAQAMPKCVATRPNGAPIRPPTPPQGANPKLPLQVWAGPLSGGRLAVALVNAGSSTVEIEATWSTLGIPPGTAMRVRDATAGTANGTATRSVSAQVESHDVVVLTLAPAAP